VDTDAAWNKLKKKIAEKKEVKVIPIRSTPWLRIAVMVLLVAGAGIALYIMRMKDIGEEHHYITFDAASSFILPDSSTIFLNKYSEATVTITEDERKVQLKGEGFFTVVHNEKQPFIVEAAGLQCMIKKIILSPTLLTLTQMNYHILQGFLFLKIRVCRQCL